MTFVSDKPPDQRQPTNVRFRKSGMSGAEKAADPARFDKAVRAWGQRQTGPDRVAVRLGEDF
jgi:hypothetical protein